MKKMIVVDLDGTLLKADKITNYKNTENGVIRFLEDSLGRNE